MPVLAHRTALPQAIARSVSRAISLRRVSPLRPRNDEQFRVLARTDVVTAPATTAGRADGDIDPLTDAVSGARVATPKVDESDWRSSICFTSRGSEKFSQLA